MRSALWRAEQKDQRERPEAIRRLVPPANRLGDAPPKLVKTLTVTVAMA
jgi:hypothetical protein